MPEITEIHERQNRMSRELDDVRTRLTAVETDHVIANVHRTNVENRLAAIEDTLRWIVKLILGAIILALLGFIVQSGLPT